VELITANYSQQSAVANELRGLAWLVHSACRDTRRPDLLPSRVHGKYCRASSQMLHCRLEVTVYDLLPAAVLHFTALLHWLRTDARPVVGTISNLAVSYNFTELKHGHRTEKTWSIYSSSGKMTKVKFETVKSQNVHNIIRFII